MAYSRSENTLSSVSSPLSQIPQALIMWKAAIYIRLSKDDGDKQESNSYLVYKTNRIIDIT